MSVSTSLPLPEQPVFVLSLPFVWVVLPMAETCVETSTGGLYSSVKHLNCITDTIKKRKWRDLPSPQAKLPKSGVSFYCSFFWCVVLIFFCFCFLETNFLPPGSNKEFVCRNPAKLILERQMHKVERNIRLQSVAMSVVGWQKLGGALRRNQT